VADCLCLQYKLPDIENETLDRLYDFIGYLNDQRPFPAALIIMKLVSGTLYLTTTIPDMQLDCWFDLGLEF